MDAVLVDAVPFMALTSMPQPQILALEKVQVNFNKVTIRRKPGSAGVMTGANTLVEIDGVPLTSCVAVSFEVEARGLASVTLKLLGELDLEGTNVDVTSVNVAPKSPAPRYDEVYVEGTKALDEE